MIINFPTILSLFRVFIIPLLIVVFYAPVWWSATVCVLIFILAAVTDVLDGYLARRSDQVTRFGAFIDPIADKLIVSVTLILIAEREGSWIVTLPILVIVAREITISGLREWMAGLGLADSVAVSWLGKVKTVMQMTAIICLLWRTPIVGFPVFELGLVLLYGAAVLTIWSMCFYLLAAKRSIK